MTARSSSRPSPRAAPNGFPARRAAAELIEQVLEKRRHFDDAESAADNALAQLDRRDRAFARAAATTVFRRLGEIDAALAQRLRKPLPEEAVHARSALRLGAAELLFLRTPDYAAVDAAVRLCRGRDHRLKGLVNAVLRRLGEQGAETPTAAAARLNTPGWLWDRLQADWGQETALAIATAHLETPPLDLTPKHPDSAEALAAALGGAMTPTGAIRLRDAGPVAELAGFESGEWWVQDSAAALPARLLAPTPDLRVLDLCAAPGGKTLQLAAAGAAVTALDASESRLRRLEQNLSRCGLEAEIVAAEAAAWIAESGRRFDAVLLDAPCTASGTLRRHPEGAWLKSLDALDALTAAQDTLLDAAWAALRPGGRLVYCVCSLFRREGEDRADAFANRHADAVKSLADATAIGDPALVSARQGAIRTLPSQWPERGGLDGFFAVRWDKPS